MWTNIYRAKLAYEREKAKHQNEGGDEKKDEDGYIPAWFNKYIEYKFNLYDRAGTRIIFLMALISLNTHNFSYSKRCRTGNFKPK